MTTRGAARYPRPADDGGAGRRPLRPALHVAPERWDAIDLSPAPERVWLERLSAPRPVGVGARLALQGAINRGELHQLPDGRLASRRWGQLALNLG